MDKILQKKSLAHVGADKKWRSATTQKKQDDTEKPNV